jgi:hypothetical protein
MLVRGQPETFDIVTYHLPANWKKQTTGLAVSLYTVDNVLGTWRQVGIYRHI